ncbi:MAG: hypothetical protein AAGE52_20145 [Myxococcota bacterium]
MSYGHSPAGSPCARCHSPTERDDLRCPVCALPLPRSDGGAQRVVAKVLRCDSCGAALTYDVSVQAPKCAFCGSVAHLEESEDPIEEAEAYLPFRVDPQTARQALKSWLGSQGFFRPSDLASASAIDSLTPLWWVGWTFDVEALVSWTADSNAGAGRSAWAPHSGQSSLRLTASLVSASRGLEEWETTHLAPHFDLRTAQAQPHEMPGAAIERFDIPRSAARRVVAQGLRKQARQHAQGWIPGSRFRNLHVEVMPKSLHTRRYAFPTYVLAYRYRDKAYRAIVHGQNAQCTFGKAPYSILKILLVAGGILAGIALLILIFVLATG